MTKKELIKVLENIDDEARILFGKDDYSNYVASDLYVRIGYLNEETEILITNKWATPEVPTSFDKIS